MTGQIVVADSYSMPSGTEDFTVSAWTKATQADVSLLVLDSDFETQGNWQSAGSGGEVNFDNPTGKLRSESGGSGNNRIPYYDLGTVSETGWILRWTMEWANAPDNYGTPFMTLSNDGTSQQSSSQNYVTQRFDGGSIGLEAKYSATLAGGTTHVSSPSYTSGVWYHELIRDGSNVVARTYTDSTYQTVDDEATRAISNGSGDMGLQYVKFVPRWDSGSGDYDVEIDDMKFCNGQTVWANCFGVEDEIGTVLSFETKEPSVTTFQAGQGHNGGSPPAPPATSAYPGGGGGGAGEAGEGAYGGSTDGGKGGDGRADDITGTSVIYAGGGGGGAAVAFNGGATEGAGGTGGGGEGRGQSSCSQGTDGLGGGGGGGGTSNGCDGGDGTVILRTLTGEATGGTTSTVSGDTVHTFNSNGNFVLSTQQDVRYLIVAGGGSGGSSKSDGGGMGGGGAGGMLSGTVNLVAGTYPVVVGTGATINSSLADGGTNNSPDWCANTYYSTGKKGGDSSWNGIVTKGGGAGASGLDTVAAGCSTNQVAYDANDVRDGGSGGGGGWESQSSGNDYWSGGIAISTPGSTTTTYPTKTTAFEVEPTKMRIAEYEDVTTTTTTTDPPDTAYNGADQGCDNTNTESPTNLGNSWFCNGSGSGTHYVDIPKKWNTVAHDAFTYSMWVYQTYSGQNQIWFDDSGSSNGGETGVFCYNNNDMLICRGSGGVSNNNVFEFNSGSNTITTNAWTHWVLQYEKGNGAYLYKNNVLLAQDTTLDGDFGSSSYDDPRLFWCDSNCAEYKLGGYMDQFIIYKKFLSDSERTALYNSGDGDSTPDEVDMLVHYDFEQTSNTLENVAQILTITSSTAPTITNTILEETVSLTPNDWKHVSWVRDGSSWKSIVDGTQVGNTVTQATSLGTAKSTPAGTSTSTIFEDDFDTDDWTHETNKSNGAGTMYAQIDSGLERLEFKFGRDSDIVGSKYDLGTPLGENWKLSFDYRITTQGTGYADSYMIGLTDTDSLDWGYGSPTSDHLLWQVDNTGDNAGSERHTISFEDNYRFRIFRQ